MLLASFVVVVEALPSVLLVLRPVTLDPIFTVGGSAATFDKEYEGLNTALPLLDANSSLSFIGLMVPNVAVGRVGFCPRLSSLSAV